MGIKRLRKTQAGLETTAGTAVAATVMLRVECPGIEDQSDVRFSDADIGFLSGIDDTYTAKRQAAATMTGECTFEQMPYILTCGVAKDVAGSADGSGYIYTFAMPTTVANTISYMTIEAGDDQQAYEMAYGFVDSFNISGSYGEPLTFTANWIGRQKNSSTFTTLSVPSYETMLFQKAKLYIDAVGGTIGATQVLGTFLGVNIDVDTGRRANFTGDGNLYFTDDNGTMPTMSGSITFEYDATGEARWDDFAAETAKLFRIKVLGSTLNTAGSAYTSKTFLVDFAAKVTNPGVLAEDDGNDTVTVEFEARYNSTAAFYSRFVVVNQIASL